MCGWASSNWLKSLREKTEEEGALALVCLWVSRLLAPLPIPYLPASTVKWASSLKSLFFHPNGSISLESLLIIMIHCSEPWWLYPLTLRFVLCSLLVLLPWSCYLYLFSPMLLPACPKHDFSHFLEHWTFYFPVAFSGLPCWLRQ